MKKLLAVGFVIGILGFTVTSMEYTKYLMGASVAIPSIETIPTNFLVLAQNKSGEETLSIPRLTCQNGARVEMTLDTSNVKKKNYLVPYSVVLSGVIRSKSAELVTDELFLSTDNPTKVLHLPSQVEYDSRTVFPEYQIMKGSNSKLIKYSVTCY